MTQGYRASDWKEDEAITKSGNLKKKERKMRKMDIHLKLV